MRKALGLILATTALVGMASFAKPAAAQQTLTVWFTKGFYEAEDKALYAFIERFEKKHNAKVQLSLFSTEDIITKTVSAVEAGTPPDVGFGTTYDFRTTGKWANDNKIEDLTDIINPIKDKFLPGTLETVYLNNATAKKRAYYAMPVQQQTIHTFYWKDMIEEAGFKTTDIPTDWKGYWSFWCDKVQPALRAKGKRVYGIGHPSSIAASDTFYSFLTFVNAYDASPVDKDGNLTVDNPKVKQGLVNALKDYADVNLKGCTPPSSVTWTDTDNNVNFHNKTTVMTHNATISIPSSHLDNANKGDAQARINYDSLIQTAGWPKKPDGGTLPNLAAVKTAVVFADAKQKALGKQFLAMLLEEENLNPFVEGSLGRWFTVTKSGAERSFWTDGKDPHRKQVYQQFIKEGTIPFQFVYDYHFTTINAENVWGRAIARVAGDKISPEQAVDEMIARIKVLVKS